MAKTNMRQLTYRTKPCSVKLAVLIAERLVGDRVVVWLTSQQDWKRGHLVSIDPATDTFRVKWDQKGSVRKMKGIWRLHPPSLFRGGNKLLPIDESSATVPESTNNASKEAQVATRKTKPAAKRTTKPAATTRKTRQVEVDEEPDTNGAARRTDKLAGLTDARKRNIARLIHKERSKSPATSWGDITDMIREKYGWELPGSMTGRRLLREALPDVAEEAIIQQTRSTTDAPKKKTSKKKAKVVEEELEDVEEELDEEELEEEYEEELEEEDEEYEEEDEDEDEDEEEEPVVAPKAKKRAPKRVAVTRGRGKKS